MKKTIVKVCGGAALAALIIGLLLAVVLIAKPIEDVCLGGAQIEHIRCIEMQRLGGEKIRLKREQAGELTRLINSLDMARDRSVMKCAAELYPGQSNTMKLCLWKGETQTVAFSGEYFRIKQNGRFVRYKLTDQSAFAWKKYLNDLWGDGLYDEELLCV